MGEEGFVIMSAGGETVARVLCNAIYHVLELQWPLDKVLPEVQRADILGAAQLEQLPWLVREQLYPSRQAFYALLTVLL